MSSQQQERQPEAIKYGDIFDVQGELASKPVGPQDAAMLQSVEEVALGETAKGGAAAVMLSAADANERRGFVSHADMTDIVADRGVSVSETEINGYRVITESIGGQVVGQYEEQRVNLGSDVDPDACTIGEALEAAALAAEDKVVDVSDAAAIQAAEARATGLGVVVPGGLAAEAQSAAAYNARTAGEAEKATLGDVLTDATTKLIGDKAVTRKDAEKVIHAEARNNPDKACQPGGVAASLAAAARLNQE